MVCKRNLLCENLCHEARPYVSGAFTVVDTRHHRTHNPCAVIIAARRRSAGTIATTYACAPRVLIRLQGHAFVDADVLGSFGVRTGVGGNNLEGIVGDFSGIGIGRALRNVNIAVGF